MDGGLRREGLLRAPGGAQGGVFLLGRWKVGASETGREATCGCEVERSRYLWAEHQRPVRGIWGGTEPRAKFAPRNTGHPVASEFQMNMPMLQHQRVSVPWDALGLSISRCLCALRM